MTPTTLLPKFRELFPEFATTSDTIVLNYLEIAILTFNKCEKATLYLTAHNLIMGLSTSQSLGNNQDALPLSKMQVNGKSAEFMQIAASKDAQYGTTNYGLFFIQLKKACARYVFGASTGSNLYY